MWLVSGDRAKLTSVQLVTKRKVRDVHQLSGNCRDDVSSIVRQARTHDHERTTARQLYAPYCDIKGGLCRVCFQSCEPDASCRFALLAIVDRRRKGGAISTTLAAHD